MAKTYYKKFRNPYYVRMRTMTINDKREKETLNRHKHEIHQAKLLDKEIKDAKNKNKDE